MASRRKPKTDDSGAGSSGRTSSGRTTRTGPAPSPKEAPKMLRRVVHDGKVLEIGDPAPKDATTLKRWRARGWVDHG